DVRLNAAAGFYQLALDMALRDRLTQSITDLWKMTAAAGPNMPKADSQAVGAEGAQEQQNLQRLKLACVDDEIRLHTILHRPPGQLIQIDGRLESPQVRDPIDDLVIRAWKQRLEILETALAEENAETALKLAKLQYAPDFAIGYSFNHYLLTTAAPAP